MKYALVFLCAILALAAFEVRASEEEPTCPCPRIYRPVCSNEGRTYSNECVFNCHQKHGHADARIVRQGECPKQDDNAVYV